MQVSNRKCPFCGAYDVWYLEPWEKECQNDMYCRKCHTSYNSFAALESQEQIDLVNVVRCQNCKYALHPNTANPSCSIYYGLGHYNQFCSEGAKA